MPDFRRQVVAGSAEDLDRLGEQDSFPDGNRFWLEILLVGLIAQHVRHG